MAHRQLSDIDVHVPKVSRLQIVQLRFVDGKPYARTIAKFILQRVEDLIERGESFAGNMYRVVEDFVRCAGAW